ncbi:MAG TPA: oligopeptide:H+ symporter [Rhizomicrobium sp.]|nr:oligopeptide:H+ symporter [Rhizomicrobium sp.]
MTTQTSKNDKVFLGHPAGLGWLSGAEFWERFSYYGMLTLLVLYMVNQLQLPGHVEHVWGFALFRSLVGSFFHTHSIKGIASATVGLYSGLVYLTPIAGGILAERFIGRTRAVTLGAVLMAIGHFLMAFDATFLVALLCLLTGVGCFKGNIATQVGDLYGAEDPRRADGFQIYYIGIQIAVIGSPILCGYLADRYGWHWGFGVAGVGMLIGLCIYLLGRPTFPPEPLAQAKSGEQIRPPLDAKGRFNIAVLVLLVPVLAVSAIGNQQIFNSYLVWAGPVFNLTFLGFSMPVTWLVSVDSIVSTVTMVGSIMFWRWWAARWREPDELSKIIIGVLISASGPLALAAAAAAFAATGHRVSLGYAIAFHVLNDIGFANVFPVMLALYTRASPKGYAGIMVPICYLSLFFCGLGIGWLGAQLDHMSGTQFWLMHAGLIAGAGVVLLAIRIAFGRSLTPVYEEPHAAAQAA